MKRKIKYFFALLIAVATPAYIGGYLGFSQGGKPIMIWGVTPFEFLGTIICISVPFAVFIAWVLGKIRFSGGPFDPFHNPGGVEEPLEVLPLDTVHDLVYGSTRFPRRLKTTWIPGADPDLDFMAVSLLQGSSGIHDVTVIVDDSKKYGSLSSREYLKAKGLIKEI